MTSKQVIQNDTTIITRHRAGGWVPGRGSMIHSLFGMRARVGGRGLRDDGVWGGWVNEVERWGRMNLVAPGRAWL